jgi:hypothetical protein
MATDGSAIFRFKHTWSQNTILSTGISFFYIYAKCWQLSVSIGFYLRLGATAYQQGTQQNAAVERGGSATAHRFSLTYDPHFSR